MRTWAAVAALLGIVLLTCQVTAQEADFWVAPGGSDRNPGTADRPFATIVRARDAVRARIGAGLQADLTVLIRGGTYEQVEPLVFGLEDSGSAEHGITYAAYPGETAVVSGGRRLTGWQRGEGEVWSAPVDGDWAFRQVFVNGRRAVRARTPNLDAEPWTVRLTGAELAPDMPRHTLTFAPEALAAWRNIEDVEVVVLGEWEVTRKRLQAVDPATGGVTLLPPHVQGHPNITPRPGMAAYFENAREMLDQPGEWYLDRTTAMVTYWPRPGEDLETAEVVAPVLTRLLEVRGTDAEPVRNLHFRGLWFAYTDWPLPPAGYTGAQACFYYPGGGETEDDRAGRMGATVEWEFAEGCSLTDGQLADLGGVGLALRRGCRGNRIEGNEVCDIGGNGIMVGENLSGLYAGAEGGPPEIEVPRDNRIANNHVHRCGLDYYGAVGIWVAFTDGTVVAHNLVHDLPYTGVSLGFEWDTKPTVCANNVVEYSDIHDVMQKLADGGCIYTLGRQPGTVLRGNLLHDVHYSEVAQQSPFSNNGIFFDQGSQGYLVEGNAVYGTAGPPIRFNQSGPDEHTLRDNLFGVPVAAQGRFGAALGCDAFGSSVEVPHSDQLEPAQLTVEAWVRTDELPDGRDPRRWIVSKSRNEWEQGHYALMVQGDMVGAYLNIGGGQENMLGAWSAPGLLTLNVWHHLAMSYDGAMLRVYCDGRQVAESAIDRPREPGTGPLCIGRRPDAYSYFRGAIDEARIYDRALSPVQIAAHAAATGPLATPDEGLIAYWSFDDLTDTQEAVQAVAARAGLEEPYRGRLGD